MLDDEETDVFDHFDLSSFAADPDYDIGSPLPPSSPLGASVSSRASSPLSAQSHTRLGNTDALVPEHNDVHDGTGSDDFDEGDGSQDSASCVDAMLYQPDSDDEEFEFETGGIETSSMKFPKGLDANGNQWMTIVDITGVHHLPVHFCACDDAPSIRTQLIRLALYPVTYDRPETVFTFRVLEDFDLENLETKASAQRYYAKLRRLTSNAFPQSVPDRYREFMRIMREWRNLQQRMRAGVHYTRGPGATPAIAPGGLALFCPACPQPGVNLPDDWQQQDDQYVFPSIYHPPD